MAAVALAIGSGGAVTDLETTVLLRRRGHAGRPAHRAGGEVPAAGHLTGRRRTGRARAACESAGMATIHRTTMVPGKLDLLGDWLPRQPWYRSTGTPPQLTRAGGFRLDDPAGEVGIEFIFVTDGIGRRGHDVLRPADLPRRSAARGGGGAGRHLGARGARPALDLRRRARPGRGRPVARLPLRRGRGAAPEPRATPPIRPSAGTGQRRAGPVRPRRSGWTRTPGRGTVAVELVDPSSARCVDGVPGPRPGSRRGRRRDRDALGSRGGRAGPGLDGTAARGAAVASVR